MKTLLTFLLMIGATAVSNAQWQTAGDNDPIVAFGVHDTSLFSSAAPHGFSGSGGVARFIPTGPPDGHWTKADNGIDFSQGNVTSFASLGRYFFAGMTASGGGPGTSWRSSDTGKHWVANGGGYVCSNGRYVFCVSNGIYRSKDSGNDNTWEKVSNIVATSIAAQGWCIIASTPNGVYRSLDSGSNWTKLNSPAPGALYTMGTLLFMVSQGHLYLTRDSAESWNEIVVMDGNVQQTVKVFATDTTNIFVGTLTNGVLFSTDTGKTWTNGGGLGKFHDVQALCVFDTLLFVNAGDGNLDFYTVFCPLHYLVTPKSGVAEVPLLRDTLLIYPNPITNHVTISGSGTSLESVSVLNVLGDDVFDASSNHQSELTLDLSQLPAGTYFLRVVTERGSEMRKIVKE